jgi:steroid 5-alpha reductase family enzyme
MSLLAAYATAGLVILAGMVVLWAASLALRNASIIDIFWGMGFVAAAWLYFAVSPAGFPGRKILLCTLVSLWGLRLSGYILWRNWGKA